ncbi:hypothetical protein ACH5RR_005832 [Cinchona calisaya]|uniref:Uncharacterized protein n=1 Tax=Cinchona calisaya TaxID=153742 RepID=A0ABD3AMJ5_9GENT
MGSSRSAIVDERFCFEEETHLTVHKTSIFIPGCQDCFVVYNPAGDIIFRVDSYGPDSAPQDELVLMDSAGKSLVTLLRKKPSLHQRWEGFLGEKGEQEPIFSIFKSSIIGRFDLVAEVYGHDQGEECHIEGSFTQRSCSIYSTRANSELKELVAEIKRKVDPDMNIMLGKDVFLLCLQPLVDGAFMMSLMLVLDRLGGIDIDDGNQADPVVENNTSS